MNYEIGQFFLVKTIDVGFRRRRRPLCNERTVFYSTNFASRGAYLQQRCSLLGRFAGLRVSRFPVGASIRRLGVARASYSHLRRSHSRRPSPSSSSFHALGFSAYPSLQLPHNQNSRSVLQWLGKWRTKDTKRLCSFAKALGESNE